MGYLCYAIICGVSSPPFPPILTMIGTAATGVPPPTFVWSWSWAQAGRNGPRLNAVSTWPSMHALGTSARHLEGPGLLGNAGKDEHKCGGIFQSDGVLTMWHSKPRLAFSLF
jgi:hypothetical protein